MLRLGRERMRKSVGQRIPEKEIANFQFYELNCNKIKSRLKLPISTQQLFGMMVVFAAYQR